MKSNPLKNDLDHILTHTEELWNELRGERIFITGGTGFFGCWLLESFIWANDQLGLGSSALVLSRNPKRLHTRAPHLVSHPAVDFHVGDVRSFEFPKGTFSHIIHAATETANKQNAEDPILMTETIVQGTQRTLEFARRCGAKKVLLTSSGAVYGKQPSDLSHIPEDYIGAPDVMNPRSAYGEGKRLAECLCALYANQYGIEAKIARGFAFVGPYLPLNAHFAIGNFIRDGISGGPIQVLGDGTPYRSYLYAADLMIWLWTILFQAQSCRPYNVGSEQAISLGELAKIVSGIFEPQVPVRVLQQPVPGKTAERYVPSTQRAQLELGLCQYVSLSEAIRKTVNWYSKVTQR